MGGTDEAGGRGGVGPALGTAGEGGDRLVLTPRPVAASIDELVGGADDRWAFRSGDAKSGS